VTRICANCGTEVDDDALFCPTCGQPMQSDTRPELPPAPDWPETRSVASQPSADADATQATMPAAEAAPPDEEVPEEQAQPEFHAELGPHQQAPGEVPPWRRGSAHAAGVPPAQSATPEVRPASTERPQDPFGPPGVVTMPETLAAWMVGGGSALAFIALFLPWRTGGVYVAGWGLASGVNVVVALLLLGALVVIFLARVAPAVPHRELAFAALGMLGLGIGLDRLTMPLTGVGATLFLIGMLAVALGGFAVLLGFDRVVGGPRS
jgi:hypothetical protein